jgi:hypothetical protein
MALYNRERTHMIRPYRVGQFELGEGAKLGFVTISDSGESRVKCVGGWKENYDDVGASSFCAAEREV